MCSKGLPHTLLLPSKYSWQLNNFNNCSLSKAFYCWMNSMCFNIWNKFASMQRQSLDDKKKFIRFSIIFFKCSRSRYMGSNIKTISFAKPLDRKFDRRLFQVPYLLTGPPPRHHYFCPDSGHGWSQLLNKN